MVATAGTTLTGAIDPIGAIADVCAERGVWLHVDGAYGLAAAPRCPRDGASFAGLERADSVSLDAHKWLYLPKACGVVLVRERERCCRRLVRARRGLPAAPAARAARRRRDARVLAAVPRAEAVAGVPCARRRGVPRGDRSATSTRPRLLVEAGHRSTPDLELLTAPPQLSIVPFRHVPAGVADLNAHNARLSVELQRDGRVYVAPAAIDGRVYLRPVLRQLPHHRRRRARAGRGRARGRRGAGRRLTGSEGRYALAQCCQAL